MIALPVTLWLSLALLAYTYVGYPLMVDVAGWLRPRERSWVAAVPAVALVIVARNEEEWIRRRLENALQLEYPTEKLEIIVYSDASTDSTDEIVREFASSGVRLIRGDRQGGQAHGQAVAVASTEASVVVFSDANTLFEPSALRYLVAAFGNPSVGCIVGSLRYRGTDQGSVTTGESTYWRYEETLKAAESRIGSCVSGTGAIYAIRRRAHQVADWRVPSDFFLPLVIAGSGLDVRYEGRAVAIENTAKDIWAELRRHIRTAEGGAFCLLRKSEVRTLLNPFRFPRLSWQLLSHKLIRWLTGLWLVLALTSSALLASESPIYAVVASGMAILLGLGLLGLMQIRRRLSIFAGIPRIAFFFLAVSAAMLIGFTRGCAGASRATWEPQR